jgi:2-keto-3-deoxy-L-fuconate dehydrogenase
LQVSGLLTGKKALLTAAAAGIGRATALAFAREGAVVVATDIDMAALEALRTENPAIEIAQLDVTDPDDCNSAGDRWPDTEILFNAAGHVHHGTILECSAEDWSYSLDLNISSMYRMIRAILPRMTEHTRGSIINVSSVVSSIKGVADRCVYGTTKAAVIGLTRSVAVDFVGSGIRCNAICPGTIDSPSLAARMAATGDADAARSDFIARQPMKRLGTPEEVAALAVYLASDQASFTTGAVHVIDGGWTA